MNGIQVLGDGSAIADEELRDLLLRCYVDEGFTDAKVAEQVFAPAAVRARGEILHVRDTAARLAAMLILVRGGAPACRFAGPDEAELQLLGTAPEQRGHGLGRVLVEAALERARAGGYRQVLLWTQPQMLAAQRLYKRLGFQRAPERDFARDGRQFLFLTYPLRP